ncbi:MAG: uroporphyrinogen-III synthase [Gemmatimonadetes bacterium]|nr:uroporphyrinogen-III synthase [Gemmatimonadota bacterium]
MTGRPARPLEGRRILVTRASAQAEELAAAVRALGGEPVLRAAIEVRPHEDPALLDRALDALATYDWVVFTSVNGVRHVWRRLDALGPQALDLLEDGEDGRRPGQPRIAAIGPGTAAALERRGARPDYVPAEYVAEALARGLPCAPGARVLLLRADIARAALRELLAARGAVVHDVAAYRTVEARFREAPGDVDAVTFTSPSTVRGFLRSAGAVPARAAVICIGPVTARAAGQAGLRVDAVAESYTLNGLVEAVARHFSDRATEGGGG